MPNNLDDPIIETRGLAKHFGDVRAVDGIDLTIGRGEICGFLGRNEAGKTTTIRMILGKTQPVAAPVWREIATTAAILTERVGDDIKAQDQSDEIAERWAIWRAAKANRANDDNGRGVNSAAIFASLSRTLPEDAVIAVDVGNNTYSFGGYFECTHQSILMSGYLGWIGFGFPAALGAWSVTQDFPELNGRKVVSVSGDGGFGQYMGDFTTAVIMYGMDITHILLNNSKIAKIAKEQRAANFPVWQTDLHNPSFAEFANLCGGTGFRVTDQGDLDQAIADALAVEGPSLVEIITDPEHN